MGSEHVTDINKITELLLILLREKTEKYGITEKDFYLITTVPSLHDIGKAEISNAILGKPGKLTPEEFEQVEKHTVIGAGMVMNVR